MMDILTYEVGTLSSNRTFMELKLTTSHPTMSVCSLF